MEFRDIDPAYFRAPATFQFISQFVSKVEQNYRANPSLFDLDFLPLNLGIKPVLYGTPGGQHQTSHRPSPKTNHQQLTRPCVLCSAQGFESNHFANNFACEVAKLSSPDILKLISSSKVCPSCSYLHNPSNLRNFILFSHVRFSGYSFLFNNFPSLNFILTIF